MKHKYLIKISLVIFTLLQVKVLFAEMKPEIGSVVRVYALSAEPDFVNPWLAPKVSKYSGTGAILDNHQILTAAHIVNYARYIEVQKEGDSKKYIAEVTFVSPEADLALLKVLDESFFVDTTALAITKSFSRYDQVMVLGYPVGGKELSITSGFISRIEYNRYAFSNKYLLMLQIDAAINPGNSGGPVLNNNGELVGVAIQSLSSAENTSFIVPASIVRTFLKDTLDGVINGFCFTSSRGQSLSNPAIQNYYGLTENRGVLINLVDSRDVELIEGDILLSIDGKDVDHLGMIKEEYGLVFFMAALQTKQVGETVQLLLLRNGQKIEVEYKLKPAHAVIKRIYSSKMPYLIFGGLGFTPLTDNYLNQLKLNSSQFLGSFFFKKMSNGIEEFVVLSSTVLKHPVNYGYNAYHEIIASVNGEPVLNFRDFVNKVDLSFSKQTVFKTLDGMRYVLDTEKARASFKELAQKYDLAADRRL